MKKLVIGLLVLLVSSIGISLHANNGIPGMPKRSIKKCAKARKNIEKYCTSFENMNLGQYLAASKKCAQARANEYDYCEDIHR
ncbi:MAG TPA: hypothetical protein QGF02_03935 [Candidatus Babeliales bacterium]|nr:hypothetical protein [Candidatus Babeliales bacterium]